jgi:hypothetical protein
MRGRVAAQRFILQLWGVAVEQGGSFAVVCLIFVFWIVVDKQRGRAQYFSKWLRCLLPAD